ncbi:MAG TPA: FtsQ-type POTRA domain-containing protein [Actinomycetota bacterium]|nr:FtsQ-type POTRA domain-containing protein [Actinomycetota bacterium]
MSRSGGPAPRPERISTDPRFSRRRRAVERSHRKRTISTIAALGLTGAAIWGAFFSPLLRVKHVRVVGAQHTTSAQVAEVAGLDEADNLLLLSTEDLEQEILELPWVADAEIDRRLPDTVRVRIEEREPALVIEIPSGRWTIDAHGRVLQKGRAAESLPILSGAITGELEPGEQMTHKGVVGGLKVWRSLPRRLRKNIVALFAPSDERISFSFADHTLVRYGSSRDRMAKRRVLLALLQRMKERGMRASYIDIRVPTNPAISPLASPSVSPTPTAPPAPTSAVTPTPTP